MQSLFHYRLIIICLLLVGSILSCAGQKTGLPKTQVLAANSPADATYLVEHEWLQLEYGRAEQQAAPGSASKIKVELYGEAIHCNLNNDRAEDAVVFLTFQGGGSGTFFFLAAALQENSNYRGTNAILLGDRIGPPAAKVQNGLISVEYLDRSPDEPMACVPSILQTRYFILDNSTLREIKIAGDELLYQGWLVIGHEVRTFLPCDGKADLWLLGKSPALGEIISAFKEKTAGFSPYAPVFAILSGSQTAPPDAGFGTEHQGAFYASQLVRLWPRGNCRSDFIILDSPLPGANISSPLTVRGRARGTWFFEGDFPVILLDAQGKKIAASYATARGQWMTEDFVDFEGSISFTGSHTGQRGRLVLKKDNPAGLVQFDDALEIPITFK